MEEGSEGDAYRRPVRNIRLTPIFLRTDIRSCQTTGSGMKITKRSVKTAMALMTTPKRSAVTLHLYVLSATSHETPGLGTQVIALPMIWATHWAVMRVMPSAIRIFVWALTTNNSRYRRRTDSFARNIAGP